MLLAHVGQTETVKDKPTTAAREMVVHLRIEWTKCIAVLPRSEAETHRSHRLRYCSPFASVKGSRRAVATLVLGIASGEAHRRSRGPIRRARHVASPVGRTSKWWSRR